MRKEQPTGDRGSDSPRTCVGMEEGRAEDRKGRSLDWNGGTAQNKARSAGQLQGLRLERVLLESPEQEPGGTADCVNAGQRPGLFRRSAPPPEP